MTDNILITTTFKNNITLLKPFYLFYKDIWNPRQFCFFIGLSENGAREKFKKKICECLNITLKESSIKLISNIRNVYDIKVYKGEENINIIFYYTERQYSPSSLWNSIRNNLFRILHNNKNFNTFDYYLNTDNDDFFYIKNISNYLTDYNYQNNTFHAIEFLPHNNFNTDDDFNFISHSYFFRMKGVKKWKLNVSSHHWCRLIFLDNKLRNEGHCKSPEDHENVKHNYNIFDNKLINKQLQNINDFDRVCFSFGCLDLKFLKNDKHFLQSTPNSDSPGSHNIKQLEDEFCNYYKLTEEEKNNNMIINCNFLRKYFRP